MDQDWEYVGFGPRLWATVIDTVLLQLVLIPPLLWLYGPGYWSGTAKVNGFLDMVLSLGVPVAVVLVFWLRYQATPGKMAIRATIVDAQTGGAPRPRQWLLRYVGYFVALLPLGAGLIAVAFDPRKQGWHDKLAGTVVVRPKRA